MKKCRIEPNTTPLDVAKAHGRGTNGINELADANPSMQTRVNGRVMIRPSEWKSGVKINLPSSWTSVQKSTTNDGTVGKAPWGNEDCGCVGASGGLPPMSIASGDSPKGSVTPYIKQGEEGAFPDPSSSPQDQPQTGDEQQGYKDFSFQVLGDDEPPPDWSRTRTGGQDVTSGGVEDGSGSAVAIVVAIIGLGALAWLATGEK